MSYNLLTGLVSYWKLDGNSNDSVASNNGTDTSITYSAGNGKIVQGAGFVAGNSSKIAKTSTGLPTGTTFSFQVWWKGSAPVGDGIFGWGDGGAGTKRSLLIVAGNAYFGGNSADLDSATAINDGSWHHIVITCDAGSMIIYVDGTNVKTGSPSLNATSQVTRFGCRTGDSSFVTGAIDEVGVWSSVLSPTDVTNLYNSGAGLAFSSFFYVECSENQDATSTDAISSIGYNPTISEVTDSPAETLNSSYGWGNLSKSTTTWTNTTKS